MYMLIESKYFLQFITLKTPTYYLQQDQVKLGANTSHYKDIDGRLSSTNSPVTFSI